MKVFFFLTRVDTVFSHSASICGKAHCIGLSNQISLWRSVISDQRIFLDVVYFNQCLVQRWLVVSQFSCRLQMRALLGLSTNAEAGLVLDRKCVYVFTKNLVNAIGKALTWFHLKKIKNNILLSVFLLFFSVYFNTNSVKHAICGVVSVSFNLHHSVCQSVSVMTPIKSVLVILFWHFVKNLSHSKLQFWLMPT